MSIKPSLRLLSLAAASALILSACAIAPGYTDSEKEITETLQGSNFQPATRGMRDNIETQELFAQAAFWSREYELNPGDLESAIKLSAAVRKLGNPQRAIEIAQTTRALYPRDPYLTAEFAAALIASEQAYEAMQPIDEALRIAPGYARLWSLKGAALDQQENYDLARKHYAKAMQITPNDPNIMANVGLSYALSGDPRTAEGWLRRAVAVPGASQSVRQNLALILQLQGKNDEAAKYAGRRHSVGKLPALRSTPPSATTASPNYNHQSYQPPGRAAPQAAMRQQASIPQKSPSVPVSERPSIQTFESGRSSASGYSMRQGVTTSGTHTGRNTQPMTASDAARLAAKQSQRDKVVIPLEENATLPNKQQALLDQIAKNAGSRSNEPQAPIRSYPQSPQTYAAPPPSNAYQHPNTAPSPRREAARRRR